MTTDEIMALAEKCMPDLINNKAYADLREAIDKLIDRADAALEAAAHEAEKVVRLKAQVQEDCIELERLRALLKQARDFIDAHTELFNWKNGGEQLCARIDKEAP